MSQIVEFRIRIALALIVMASSASVFAAEEKKALSTQTTHPGSLGERAIPMARADIVAAAFATKLPIFVVKNAGNAVSKPSVATIECRTQSTNSPCMPNQHYVNLPAEAMPAFPPGTMMTAPYRWKYPVPALASGGELKFVLGIWPTAAEAVGLKLRVCADVDSAVIESNETNNCAEIVYVKPK
jgi:CARDB